MSEEGGERTKLLPVEHAITINIQLAEDLIMKGFDPVGRGTAAHFARKVVDVESSKFLSPPPAVLGNLETAGTTFVFTHFLQACSSTAGSQGRFSGRVEGRREIEALKFALQWGATGNISHGWLLAEDTAVANFSYQADVGRKRST